MNDSEQHSSDSMLFCVSASPSSLPWIGEMSQTQRGEQIEAAFPSHLGVRVAGLGARLSRTHELIEVRTHFFYEDLQQACAEFERVGKELAFPPGSRLTHVKNIAEGGYEFTALLRW